MLSCWVVGVWIFAAAVSGYVNIKDYSNYQVIRCNTNGTIHAQNIREFISSEFLDLLSHSSQILDILGEKEKIQIIYKNYGEICEILHENVQNKLDQENRLMEEARNKRSESYFDNYHRYEEVVMFLKGLEERFPENAKFVESIGKSVEGRDIPVIHIKKDPENEKGVRRVWFSGGIHAREWISVAVTQFLAQRILEEEDMFLSEVFSQIEFVIAPVVNPDGYEYSWTNDRMWRKNRKINEGYSSYCSGVDLNRNFENHWGGVGASSYPCAEDYRGPYAASEPETKAIQDYVMSLPNRSGGIDFHAYGQLILRSFGFGYEIHPNEKRLKEVGDGMRSAISSRTGYHYQSVRAAELYPTTGSTDDWYTQQAGMWGWTIELRDNGNHGFRLPPSQIMDTCEEIYEAMKYFATQIVYDGPLSN